jgi:large repetitive protein
MSSRHTVALTLLGALLAAGPAAAKSDPAPPAPTIRSAPPARAAATTASFSFADSKAGVSFQCSLDGAAFSACTSPKSYSSLGQGSHTFRVKAVSGASASGVTSYSWVVDTVPPPAPWILDEPSNPSRSTDARFLFVDAELDASYLCRLDGGAWDSCLVAKSYSRLSQGSHTFSVKARDAAGNVGGSTSFTWTVDSVAPPKPVLTQKPADPAPSTSASFAWTDAEPGAAFQCRLDGSDWTSCASPRSVTVSGNGTHQFAVRARDAAGNVSDATSYSWKVAQSAAFTVSGAPDGLLAPGVWRTLPLQISNPNNFTIYVTSLTVAVASSPAGCAAATNLELQQAPLSSTQTVAVPANGRATVPAALRPRLRLKNLPVNQDACKRSTFGLAYGGSATK